jgi:hypothetical protein
VSIDLAFLVTAATFAGWNEKSRRDPLPRLTGIRPLILQLVWKR